MIIVRFSIFLKKEKKKRRVHTDNFTVKEQNKSKMFCFEVQPRGCGRFK